MLQLQNVIYQLFKFCNTATIQAATDHVCENMNPHRVIAENKPFMRIIYVIGLHAITLAYLGATKLLEGSSDN